MTIVKTVNVTPTFNYQRHTEVVKRFIERLNYLQYELYHTEPEATDVPGRDLFSMRQADLVVFIERSIPHLREAMAQSLADDIQFQIATEIFPLTPQIEFCVYEGDPGLVADLPRDEVPCFKCGLLPHKLEHLFG